MGRASLSSLSLPPLSAPQRLAQASDFLFGLLGRLGFGFIGAKEGEGTEEALPVRSRWWLPSFPSNLRRTGRAVSRHIVRMPLDQHTDIASVCFPCGRYVPMRV